MFSASLCIYTVIFPSDPEITDQVNLSQLKNNRFHPYLQASKSKGKTSKSKLIQCYMNATLLHHFISA